jgi:hypothetical protein
MVTRHPIVTLAAVALCAWLCLGLFGKLVAPQGAFSRALFLALLLIALTATFTPIAQLVGNRFVRSKWYAQQSFRHALRQGLLIALAIVANLALKALDAWFWADIVLIAVAVVLVEIIALARK